MSSKNKKTPVAKKAPAKAAPAKAVAKPTAKPVAAKPASKPVTKAAVKAPSKPVAAKPVAKPAVKAAPAPTAKPAAKPAPVAKAAPAAKPVAKVVAAKAAPAAKPATAVKAPAPVAKVAPKTAAPAAKPAAKAPAPVKEMVKPLPKVVEKEIPKENKDVKSVDVSILLKTFKLIRTPFFFEVIEAEERNNKKKYSSDAKLPEKPTVCVRNRSSLVEETPEELIERLAQELEEENFGMMREFGSQMCTKCGTNIVSMEFRVDKDLGYCEECAEILRLGQSKEARKSDYQMSLLKRDPLATDDETEEGGTVDDEELEELDED